MPNPRNPPPKNSNHAVRSVHPKVRESGGYTIEFWLKLLDTASVPADNADWSARETAMRRIVFFTRVSPPRVLASLCLRSMRVCCSRIRPNHISTALTENEPALYVCMHVSMSMSMNPYMYVCMCVCVCARAHTHTHTHIHTHIHPHTTGAGSIEPALCHRSSGIRGHGHCKPKQSGDSTSQLAPQCCPASG